MTSAGWSTVFHLSDSQFSSADFALEPQETFLDMPLWSKSASARGSLRARGICSQPQNGIRVHCPIFHQRPYSKKCTAFLVLITHFHLQRLHLPMNPDLSVPPFFAPRSLLLLGCLLRCDVLWAQRCRFSTLDRLISRSFHSWSQTHVHVSMIRFEFPCHLTVCILRHVPHHTVQDLSFLFLAALSNFHIEFRCVFGVSTTCGCHHMTEHRFQQKGWTQKRRS